MPKVTGRLPSGIFQEGALLKGPGADPGLQEPESGAEDPSKLPQPKPGDQSLQCALARVLPTVAGLGEGMLGSPDPAS